mmetsp:Transcript_21263/g.46147  ORF Transcript_21263/g.46147 Transcript_21263/m.46147 type:complete len:856 (-) Transcript_21263:813-3380(-)
MRTNVPNEIVGGYGDTVNFLLPAADWMRAHNHAIDPTIVRDLKLCIRMRRRVADSIFGGGDGGHKYFLEVLVFCWTVLRLLPVAEITSTKQSTREEDAGEEDTIHVNRFSAFDMEGEEEEEEEEDTDMFPTMVPRPQRVENSVTVEDLLTSDDRNDAILFLLTLDELMGIVACQYRVLASNVSSNQRQGINGSAMIENLLDATIAANFAMQSVQQLEMELHAQHDHLTTPCRLLATLVLPEITANVDAIVRQHGSKSCNRREIIVFLGDCMECCFHNQSDSWNRKDSIVSEFVAQYEVNATGSSELEQIFQGVLRMTLLEISMKPDVGVEKLREEVAQEMGKPHNSHSWLSRMEYIAGDRSIHHTVRILQLFAGVIDSCAPDKKLLFDPRRRGMFGNPLWAPGRSTKIRDMDELLMSRLLPDWANMCRHGIMGKIKLPRDSELCPFFVQLKSYVDNPRKPVTWSLAFGVHAALTSILEVKHGLPEITGTSKSVFDNYFAQAANAGKLSLNEKSSNINNSATWKHNLCMISFLENFGLPVYDNLALWNPLCAGTSISVLNFFGNIEGGCAIIDCQAQLRIMMYLYHGLVINGIIGEGDIPLLQILYNGFKKCKALWQGSLPKRGELAKRFWISFGMGLSDSKQMSESARLLARGGRLPLDGLFTQGVRLCRGRRMHPIDPAEILTSFRRVCERDFHDVVDKYHTPEQKKNSRGTEQYTVAVHTNDTLDHLEDEIQLHAVNFIPVSYYLEQFVCSISRVLGWEALLKSFKQDNNMDMRQGFAILFAQHILGALDFATDPLNHTFQNVPGLIALSPAPNIVAGTAAFLGSFFEPLPPQNVMWFQAVDSGDGTQVEVVR